MTDEDLKNYPKGMEDRLVEQVRDSETRLLTEFHKWASPVEARQRTHAAVLRAADL